MKSAFTLIELLVVIAIIALLSTLAAVSLSGARLKARDAKRLADVRQVQSALELYLNDNGRYPDAVPNFGTSLISTTTGATTTLMAQVPKNPTSSQYYTYAALDSGASYELVFTIEAPANNYVAGSYVATPTGINATSTPGGGPTCSCTDIAQECCSNCSLGAACGGGYLVAKNYSISGTNYDLVVMRPGCAKSNGVNYDVIASTTNPTCAATDNNNNYHKIHWSSLTTTLEAGTSSTNGFSNTSALLGDPSQDNGSATDSSAPLNAAALYCYNLIINGFVDWYLPAINELSKVYQASDKCINGGGVCTITTSSDRIIGFQEGYYWSSTNGNYDQQYARVQSFSSGSIWDEIKTNYANNYMRCLRRIAR